MASVESPCRTFRAGAVLPDRVIVKFDGTTKKVFAADAGERGIGVSERPAFAVDDPIPVRLFSAQGTMEVTAGAPVAAGAELFGINGGKVDDTDPTDGIRYGVALQAAGADNDIIEMLPLTL